MTARFILSLDCEGKWGVADLLNVRCHRDLTDARLVTAYEDIVRALDEFNIPATFAFVGAFAQPAAQFGEIRDGLQALVRQAPNYVGAALADLEHGSRQGWHGDWAVERVAMAKAPHEIALHGFTHAPWTAVDQAFIHAELALWQTMSGPVRNSRTFVFPRNEVAHLDLLVKAGIQGYRQARPRTSRFRALLSEFDVWARPDPDPVGTSFGSLTAIPAGHFVNWQNGFRRIVPPFVSAYRAARMLEVACRDSEVVHFWLHPENIASAPSTMVIVKDLLRQVAHLRDEGRCTVLTQAQYCASRRPLEREASAFL